MGIIKRFESSGQKQVYLVENAKKEKYIVKVGKCEYLSSFERIVREVNILKSISSDFYPRMLNFYSNTETFEFKIVEEYIDSSTLRDILSTYTHNEHKSISLIISILKGLSIIWEKGIVHRDLKPENILIRTSNDFPVIIDLGIARIVEGKSLTRTIMHMGPHTMGYGAPEQVQNQKDIISYKTDLFAIGVLLAELILQVNPFSPQHLNNHNSINENIVQSNYTLNTNDYSISERLSTIIHKLLSVQPYKRYRSYQRLINDLEVCLHE